MKKANKKSQPWSNPNKIQLIIALKNQQGAHKGSNAYIPMEI